MKKIKHGNVCNVCRLRKMSYASQSCLWIRFPLINQSVDGKILTSSMSTSVVLWGLILKSDSWQNQSHCHIVDMTWATTTDSEGPGQIPLTWTFLTGRYTWTYLQIRLNELVGLTLKICMYKWISCDIMGGGDAQFSASNIQVCSKVFASPIDLLHIGSCAQNKKSHLFVKLPHELEFRSYFINVGQLYAVLYLQKVPFWDLSSSTTWAPNTWTR